MWRRHRFRNYYGRRRRRCKEPTTAAAAVNGVIEDGFDAVNGDGGVYVEVGVGDGRSIDGEVGSRVVGDENGVGWQESWEARVGLEELQVGETEA
ncbi:hypothetical protein U1Q18_009935 [Sarracenia purpurea var. burkii]